MTTTGLYLGVEISWGSQWVNLNDHERFTIAGGETRETIAKTWRKTTVQSPILSGDYLVHAVPEMVAETIAIWVHGHSQTELSDNLALLDQVFSQYDYRIRWTMDEYRETWTCQLADASFSLGHVWTHNKMAKASYTVPRYAETTRESIL